MRMGLVEVVSEKNVSSACTGMPSSNMDTTCTERKAIAAGMVTGPVPVATDCGSLRMTERFIRGEPVLLNGG